MADIANINSLVAAVGRPTRPSMIARLNAQAAVGGALVLLVCLAALAAPWIAPHPPLEQDLMNALMPPAWISGGDWSFPLGTDELGRDVLSRLIYGARITLSIALMSAILSCLFGSLVGLIAGFFGGIPDQIVSRMIDTWVAFPPVLLAIVLSAMLGTGITSIVIAIAVVDWTRFARVIRSEAQVQATMDYVAASQILGLRHLSIMFLEVLPNVLPLMVTLLTVEMGIAAVVEAVLAFVGHTAGGSYPTWGSMIATGRGAIYHGWWILVFPSATLILTVLSFNLLGDGMRRLIDPVHR